MAEEDDTRLVTIPIVCQRGRVARNKISNGRSMDKKSNNPLIEAALSTGRAGLWTCGRDPDGRGLMQTPTGGRDRGQ